MADVRNSLLALAASAALVSGPAAAQNFTGRWVYEEGGERATLDLRQDASTGRVSGTLDVSGAVTRLTGRVDGMTVQIGAWTTRRSRAAA